MDGPERDRDVITESLRVEAKLFYFDLKENARGRYLRVTERGTKGDRSTIIVPSAGIPWFVQLFSYYASSAEGGQPVTKELPIETKIFFFELGENPRGRFLRISESGAGPRGRSSIIVPAGASGTVAWTAFRDALQNIESINSRLSGQVPGDLAGQQNLQAMYGFNADASADQLSGLAVSGPQTVVGPGRAPPTLNDTGDGGQTLRVGHKRFFFDPGSNAKGAFLRITEVVGTDRISIMVPWDAVPQFRTAVSLVEAGGAPQASPPVSSSTGADLVGQQMLGELGCP